MMAAGKTYFFQIVSTESLLNAYFNVLAEILPKLPVSMRYMVSCNKFFELTDENLKNKIKT